MDKIILNSPISVRCAEPVIIVNPKIKRNISLINYIHHPGEHFKLSVKYHRYSSLAVRLSRLKDKCNYDNINDFYAVTYDGEIINLFIEVPCNKCFICKDKLTQMWQFRGIAESNSSQNNTYFVTLTYNNEHLPYNGVSVTAIQLFMKRLRNNLDKLNIPHKLKYFACGEYGKNTSRPHYHLILWHFPDNHFSNLRLVLEFIEKSWSVWNYETEEHEPIGFAYCKKCDNGSLAYVMKYARKLRPAPENKNPYFTCCSKFIGLQWFFDNYTYLKNNPHVVTLSINDNSRNKLFTSPLPTYYKYKLMPSLSQIFPKEISLAFDFCLSLHNKLSTINHILPDVNYKVPQILNNYYALFTDFTSTLSACDIDDCYYYRYSAGCPFAVNQIYQETQLALQPYLYLLEQYYNKNIKQYLNGFNLQKNRQIMLDKMPKRDITLDLMRIENEKIERFLKKSSEREYF